jgi:hypothetical protein
MKTVGPDLKRTLARSVAALQICIGALLLVGTVYLTLTAYKTVRYESEQIAENLSAAGKALESVRVTYGQSADSLFGLTDAMDDISTKLSGVSETVCGIGELFSKVWLAGAGEKWKDVGKDIASISEAVKKQGEAIKLYRDDGHAKTMIALTETIESLRHAERMLDNSSSSGRWCGFVCILGFCVSMLFFANGLLLLVFAKGMSVE